MFGVPRLRGIRQRSAAENPGLCQARAPNFSKYLITYAYLLNIILFREKNYFPII